jgi:hypothetical protein
MSEDAGTRAGRLPRCLVRQKPPANEQAGRSERASDAADERWVCARARRDERAEQEYIATGVSAQPGRNAGTSNVSRLVRAIYMEQLAGTAALLIPDGRVRASDTSTGPVYRSRPNGPCCRAGAGFALLINHHHRIPYPSSSALIPRLLRRLASRPARLVNTSHHITSHQARTPTHVHHVLVCFNLGAEGHTFSFFAAPVKTLKVRRWSRLKCRSRPVDADAGEPF